MSDISKFEEILTVVVERGWANEAEINGANEAVNLVIQYPAEGMAEEWNNIGDNFEDVRKIDYLICV